MAINKTVSPGEELPVTATLNGVNGVPPLTYDISWLVQPDPGVTFNVSNENDVRISVALETPLADYNGTLRGVVTDAWGRVGTADLPVDISVTIGCGEIGSWSTESSLYYDYDPLDFDASWPGVFTWGGWSTAMTPDGSVLFSGVGLGAAVDTVGVTAGTNFDGHVTVYELVNDEYIELTRFSHNDATGSARDDNFASSTSAGDSGFRKHYSHIIATNDDGTFVAVGAPEYINGALQGAVYLFTRNGSSYDQIGRFDLSDTYPSNGGAGFEGPPDSTSFSRAGFGHSVQLRGDGGPGSVLFVSHPEAVYNDAPWGDTQATYVGFVYAFTNVAGTWTNTHLVTTYDPLISGQQNDIYGDGHNMRISGDGNTLITGMWHLWRGTFDPGDNVVAYKVYRWNSGTGAMDLYSIIQPDDLPFNATSNGYFDFALSNDGSRIVTTDAWLGMVYVWDDNGDGTFAKTILRDDGAWYNSCVMCGSGDVLAFSDLYGTGNPDPGRVFFYKLVGGVWTLQETIADPIPARPGSTFHASWGDYTFGWALSMSESGLITFGSSPEWYDEEADNNQIYTGGAVVVKGGV